MAGSSNFDGYSPAANINVTPFVDVALVLLVVFMITAPMMQQGVDVNLPKVAAGPVAGGADEQVVISIDHKGTIFIGKDNVIDLSDLPKKITAVMEARQAADRKVYIRADSELVYGRVMSVMAKLHESGINQIGLISAPPDVSETRMVDKKKK
ncbi:MAG: protein TolR [Deltaproteobacteria bacterium]|nr:protein TolR [Deltaproteobacteria bacterium]